MRGRWRTRGPGVRKEGEAPLGPDLWKDAVLARASVAASPPWLPLRWAAAHLEVMGDSCTHPRGAVRGCGQGG